MCIPIGGRLAAIAASSSGGPKGWGFVPGREDERTLWFRMPLRTAPPGRLPRGLRGEGSIVTLARA